MKLGRINISLARPKPQLDTEAGTAASGDALFSGELIETEKIKTKDYIQMRQQDGTAAALYNVLTLPILSNTWDIEPEDDSPEAKKQADFVWDALNSPPHRGGMTTPFSLVLADMLRATIEGYRLFEKVYALKDGKIVFRKIASRDSSSITLLEDERGGFNGAKQRAFIGKKYDEVTIPRDKCFLFTFGKEKHWLKGESAFRAAYYHYDKKHRLYYLAHQAVQQFAIVPKVATAPTGAKQDQIDSAAEALAKMATNSTAGLPAGFDVKALSAQGRIDPIPLIDHHNAEMARSILAQFMMLGTGSNVGSWALSSDQSDMFILALRGLMNQIEDHITSYLIPDLIDYNFERPMYPSFVFTDLTDATQTALKEAFLKMVEKAPAGAPDYLFEGVMRKMAAKLDIDIPEEDTTSDQSRKAKTTKLAKLKWKRPLTPAEENVNFEAIQRKFDELDREFVEITKPIFDQINEDTQRRLRKLLEKGDLKALDSFELKFGPELRKAIIDQMMDAYLFAKRGVSDEMGVKIPATPRETKVLIDQQAQQAVDKLFADLTFQIKTIVTRAKSKNQLAKTELAIGDVIKEVATAVGAFYNDKAILTAGVLINTAINQGRDDVFDRFKDKISRYQYSAVLDNDTCPICEDLDGNVITQAEYEVTPWRPPVHFHCRCIYVEILEDEEEKPEVTGFPDSPGGTDEPTLSREQRNQQIIAMDPVEAYKLHRKLAKQALADELDEITGDDDGEPGTEG